MIAERSPLRVRGLIGGVSLFAAALLIACGGSDDAPADPDTAQSASVAQAQSQAAAEPPSAEESQTQAAEEASEQSEQTEPPPEQEEEPAQAQAEPVEQAEEEEETVEEEEAPAEEPTEEEETPDPVDPIALLSLLHLRSLQTQEDVRFSGTLDLTVLEGSNRSLDLIQALGTFTFEGAILPGSGDLDLTIRFGRDGAGGLPPFGIRIVAGTLYTNFGFGWEAQPPDADLLELASVLIDVRGLGFDFQALSDAIAAQGRLSGLLAGDPALWSSFGEFLASQELLLPLEAVAGDAVQSYQVAEFELDSIVRVLIDPKELEVQLGIDGGIYGGYDNREGTRVTLDLDASSGLLLRLVADIDEPDVDFDILNDPGTVFMYSDFGAESVHLELQVDPVTGAPVRFLAEMPYFYVDGETSYEGSLRLEFVVESINGGGVLIEPPI